MSESWLELAIIGFIICGIAFAIYRTGAANPETTGALGARFGTLENEFVQVKGKVDHIERQMVGLEGSTAKTADFKRLEHDVSELREDVVSLQQAVAAMGADTAHSRRQIDRLYDFIVEKGMSK